MCSSPGIVKRTKMKTVITAANLFRPMSTWPHTEFLIGTLRAFVLDCKL